MDKQTKQQMKAAYLAAKPEMGILSFHCIPTDHWYFMAVTDTRGKKNGMIARFDGNMYTGSRNRRIQAEWKFHGKDQFEVEVADLLPYDKEEEKTDYSEELEMLLEDWLKKYPQSEPIR